MRRDPRTALRSDPGMGRMLLTSLGLHLAVALLFSGVILPRFERDLRPVYVVDLVNLPVKDPQAGRPDARPEPAPTPAQAAEPPAPPAPKPEPVKLSRPEPAKPEPVKLAKPEPKKPEVKDKPEEKRQSYDATQAAIENLRKKKAYEESQDAIAALRAKTGSSQGVDAPVGMPTGKGKEAGVAWHAWIQTFLKENWSLSKYQVARQDLEATVRIVYDAQGNLLDYSFLKPSGDATFDDSVKKAILRERQLPRKPEERLELEVVFNLKDLMP